MSQSKIVLTKVNECPIVVYPMSDLRSVRIEVRLHAGSWHEKSKNWGRFHLLEHVLHSATQEFKTRLDMEYFQEEHAISQNAWTSHANVGFWFYFPINSFDQGFKLLEEIIFRPLIKESDIAQEIGIIKQEYKDKISNPKYRYYRKIDKQLFGKNHIYSRDAQSEPGFFDNLTGKELFDLYKDYFGTKNMVISVIGNVEPKKVISKLGSILEKYPTGQNKRLLEFEKTKPAKRYLFHRDSTKSAALELNWKIKGWQDYSLKERMGLSLVAYLIGGSARSLLYKRLRQELGIVYSVSAWNMFFPTEGNFTVSTSVSTEKAQMVLDEIRKCIKTTLKNGIKKSDFERAKKFRYSSWMLIYDSMSNISNELLTHLFNTGELVSIEDHISELKKITFKDLDIFLKEIFDSKEEFISVMASENPKLE